MLQEKILDNSAKIAIAGLGYVGLPLALLCIQKGYYVLGIDSNKNRVDDIQLGKSYITGISDEKLKSQLLKTTFRAVIHYNDIASCDIICICVQTPLNVDSKPDYSHLLSSVTAIADRLQKGQIIIIESTVGPKTIQAQILPILLKKGFQIGQDFFLSYSPERIDPGNELHNLSNVPKLVAGITKRCTALAQTFYEQLGIPTIRVSSPVIAEMAKILENTYRDVNIALVNEMAQICHKNGINIWEVIDAASTKPYGFQVFYPGPGVGGHCIPIDSVYYTSWARQTEIPAILAEQARKINASMPEYVVERLRELLKGKHKKISESKLLILGVTYKKDIGDLRESSAIKVIKHLIDEGAQLSFCDPFIREITVNNLSLKSIDLNKENVAQQDCVILAVAHSYYNLQWIVGICPLIFDLTNATSKLNLKHENIAIL